MKADNTKKSRSVSTRLHGATTQKAPWEPEISTSVTESLTARHWLAWFFLFRIQVLARHRYHVLGCWLHLIRVLQRQQSTRTQRGRLGHCDLFSADGPCLFLTIDPKFCLEWPHIINNIQKVKMYRLTKSVTPGPEGSSPHSPEPATSPHPEPGESTPHTPPTNLPKVHFDPILPSTPWSYKCSFPWGFPVRKLYTFLSSQNVQMQISKLLNCELIK
jgi:hypothetical protein